MTEQMLTRFGLRLPVEGALSERHPEEDVVNRPSPAAAAVGRARVGVPGVLGVWTRRPRALQADRVAVDRPLRWFV